MFTNCAPAKLALMVREIMHNKNGQFNYSFLRQFTLIHCLFDNQDLLIIGKLTNKYVIKGEGIPDDGHYTS